MYNNGVSLTFDSVQVRREFERITGIQSNIGPLVNEWNTMWVPKILLYGSKECETSKALSIKLAGKWYATPTYYSGHSDVKDLQGSTPQTSLL